MAVRLGGPARRRWGLRTLGFLALVLLAVVVSNVQQHYTAITLILVVVGLCGAAYCSIRGLRQMSE